MTRRLLILGGTKFRGPALERLAIEAGYEAVRAVPNRDALDERDAADVCVDFAARSAADVRKVVTEAGARFGHYVLVSSYEVYPPGRRLRPWTESEIDLTDEPRAVRTQNRAPGNRAAERELHLTARRGIPWTILRPSVVEGVHDPIGHTRWFVERILERRPILLPSGDLPLYRQVSVRDLARAVLAVAGREETFFEAMNVTGAGLVTFDEYARQLARALQRPAGITRFEALDLDPADRVPFAWGIGRSFIAASPRLADLGWSPTPPAQWVPRLALKLAATLPSSGPVDETPIPRRRGPLPLPATNSDANSHPSGWQIIGVPSLAGSLRLELAKTESGEAQRGPLVRTRRVSLIGLNEWLLRRDTPRAPVVLGHHAVVEVLDSGGSSLRAGDVFLPQAREEGGELGIRCDGSARDCWRTRDLDLVPVPAALRSDHALLALPLARYLSALEDVLRPGDLVWIYGHRVEAVLGAWLAAEAGCEVVHVDGVKLSSDGRSTIALEEAEADVARGRALAPRVAVNASGAPYGERLLLKALPTSGALVTPFDPAPRALVRQRIRVPWTPAAGELERAMQRLAAWSREHDLSGCLAPPVPPVRFQEALLTMPFRLTSIGCREEHA
jgi:nucleoside-diphosphate-sugar epimerase